MILLIKCLVVIFAAFCVKTCLQSQSESTTESLNNDLIVQLVNPVGKIRGRILKSNGGLEYYSFQDIPYAAPPLGNLRFKPPKKHDGWAGVLNTTENTRVCPQLISTSLLPQNEDCLLLNVYTPVKPDSSDRKLAVYVWIHGGGYLFWDGTFSRYGPQYLIDYDIIIVTLNYRLGPFGFLATEDAVIPGNLGLRDQNFALQWVQNNIHLFGGDPQKVTIGGESAGAGSVGAQSLSYLSKGLFRGCILQSTSPLNKYNYQKSPDHSAFELGRNLNHDLEYGNSSRLLEILQKATISEILEAQSKFAKPIGMIPDIAWTPTIESYVKEDEAFLYKPMHESLINGNWNKVPILLGFNYMENLIFLSTSFYNKIPGSTIPLLRLEELATNLDEDSSRLISEKWNILDADKMEAGSLMKNVYTKTTFCADKKAYIRYASDVTFNLGIFRMAELVSKDVPVYLYRFSYTPFANKSFVQGAEHVEELQYFWHNIEDYGDINDFQKILRRRMLTLWTNFIKYQNPTPKAEQELDKIIWPAVSANEIKFLDINSTFKIKSRPRRYIQIRDIFNKYMKPPFYVF